MGIQAQPSSQKFEDVHSADGTRTAYYHVDDSDRYTCPMCGKCGLLRIRRRFIDRLLSLLGRKLRFRCTHSGCHWEGNLRRKSHGHGRMTP